MKKIKIGLLSTQFTINYGAVLQAYSLFKKLEKIKTSDVCVIDYSPQGSRYGHYESYIFATPKDFILSVLKIINLKYRFSRKRKKQFFEKFVDHEFKLTKNKYYDNNQLKNAEFDLDIAIVGSDQVWNPKVIDDTSFYLDFIDDKKTIKSSYAASLGDELSPNELDIMVKKIKDYKAISLREPIQVELIKSKLQKEIDTLIDPVFLSSKDEWENLSKKSFIKLPKPYILIYEVNSPPNFAKYIEHLRKNINLDIIEISTRPFPKYKGVKTISYASPYDFLNLFSNAEFVITSSFHGVAFSSIFNKKFKCALNNERSFRQRHLLKSLSLESCEISNTSHLSSIDDIDIDWDNVNKNINNMVKESENYLNNVVNYVT